MFKKFFALGLAFALMGSAVMPLASASREAYHSYLYNKIRAKNLKASERGQYRYFSERRGNTRMLLQRSRTPRYSRIRGIRYTFRNSHEPFEMASYAAQNSRGIFRPISNRYSGWRKRVSRQAVTVGRIRNAVSVYETYANGTFSIQVPKDWNPVFQDGGHFFRHPVSDFTVRVKRMEKPCGTVSFTTCGIQLSKTINGKDNIMTAGKIRRQTQVQVAHAGTNEATETYSESFVGYVRGKKILISRYFVNDNENGVYVVETRTAERNGKFYLGVSKRVFDSLRIY